MYRRALYTAPKPTSLIAVEYVLERTNRFRREHSVQFGSFISGKCR